MATDTKSESKLSPLTQLLRSEFGSVTNAAEHLGVTRITLWRWMTRTPERLMELLLYGSDPFAHALIKELNTLMQLDDRERGGQC